MLSYFPESCACQTKLILLAGNTKTQKGVSSKFKQEGFAYDSDIAKRQCQKRNFIQQTISMNAK